VTVMTIDVSAEPAGSLDELLVGQPVERARTGGLKLTGEGSLLTDAVDEGRVATGYVQSGHRRCPGVLGPSGRKLAAASMASRSIMFSERHC
jgi:hypothetical protein